MRTAIRSALTAALIAILGALLVVCVTINVHFPEAAADRFIQNVIGEGETAHSPAIPPDRAIGSAFGRLGDWMIPSANAQGADIDIDDPQIDAIKQRMAERHRDRLSAWYSAGTIGLDRDGKVEVRDRGSVSLSERRVLEQVVAAENADRRAVYLEIAVANGHPEWEDQIRRTFAERWIANARPGWYYRGADGQWRRK